MSFSSMKQPTYDRAYAGTGGSVNDLISLGGGVGSHQYIADNATSSLLTRRIGVTYKESVSDSNIPGGFSNKKTTIIGKFPKTIASGDTLNNQIQIFISIHPETTDNEIQEILNFAGECAENATIVATVRDGTVG